MFLSVLITPLLVNQPQATLETMYEIQRKTIGNDFR